MSDGSSHIEKGTSSHSNVINRRKFLKTVGILAAGLGISALGAKIAGQEVSKLKSEQSTFILDQIDAFYEVAPNASSKLYFDKIRAVIYDLIDQKEGFPHDVGNIVFQINSGINTGGSDWTSLVIDFSADTVDARVQSFAGGDNREIKKEELREFLQEVRDSEKVEMLNTFGIQVNFKERTIDGEKVPDEVKNMLPSFVFKDQFVCKRTRAVSTSVFPVNYKSLADLFLFYHTAPNLVRQDKRESLVLEHDIQQNFGQSLPTFRATYTKEQFGNPPVYISEESYKLVRNIFSQSH